MILEYERQENQLQKLATDRKEAELRYERQNRQKKKGKLPQNGEALQSNSTVRKLQLLLNLKLTDFLILK